MSVNMLEQQNYKKARFFKCALQVNPVGYIQYRGQQQSLSEAEYNQQLLNAALEAGIEVIGLADHGSVDAIDALRNLFNQNGIVVFPGFEIASSEKIHFVCLFDESKTCQELERILGGLELLDPEDGILPTNLTASQLIEKVNKIGGFIYAAHCTNDDGLLKRRMNHIWQHKDLLAAQIPGSVEDLRGVENDFYRKVFLNKDPNYYRERDMAAINAADVAKPNDIQADGASCLIKMTKPCFESFKQAFFDAGSRVRLNSDKPECYASAIERIRFVGGYLDGLDIELSDHLNAVIGGRGTGKSTLLECIRYAFDLEPKTENAKKQHKSVIDSNLGKERGMIEIMLSSANMHCRKFTISRKYGNQPVVVDADDNISPYHPADLLPNIELYGQNEIYEMTRDEVSRNQLIERFLEGEHQKFDADIAKVLVKLKENRELINRALKQKDDIEAEVERLPKLLERAKQFQTLGIDEKLKIIPKLEKEKQFNEWVSDSIGRVKTAIEALKESLPDTVIISDTNLEGLPHEGLLKQQRDIFETLKLGLTQQLGQLEHFLDTTTTQLSPIQHLLAQKQQSEEQQLENAFKEIPANQGKTGRQIGVEYQALLKQIEQIRPKQTTLQNQQSQIHELYNQRKKLLLELDQRTTARASSMQKLIKRLNRKLNQKVKLTLKPEGNRQRLIDFLNNCNLEGVGLKRLAWVLEQEFSPVNLAATIRQGETELEHKFSIPISVVRALMHLPEQKLLEIEELLLLDTMTIELNVTHGEQDAIFRPIDDLSTGQQCTAVLHLLLLDNQDPLILDQPEDNLDNAFIAERIVAELRGAKLSRQFLFATHNANIPVFGDAEWIGVLSVQDNKGIILPEQQGAIDVPKVQEMAADILEGGRSAFNQRREKYGFK